MPPLKDAELIATFRLAFEERRSGGVRWKRVPAEWVRKNLRGSCSPTAIDDLNHEHLTNGGDIDQAAESRDEYRFRYRYHYDFRLSMLGKRLYVETVLDDSKMGPIVTVVNIHLA